jgi:hypothetical protein
MCLIHGACGLIQILDERKIKETIERIEGDSLTVLDFMDKFRGLYPADWNALIQRFGRFGEKRRYTVTTYLSNRLDLYSRKPDSILKPFVRYSQTKFQSYRRTTEEERKRFGSPWIAVFRKRATH